MDVALDPELAALAPSIPPLDLTDVAATRALLRQAQADAPPYEAANPLDVLDLTVPGHDGGPDVPCRLHRPARRTGPLPALVYLHGGAFVLGGLDELDAESRRLADLAGVAVLGVDYRLAPEHPYPAALEDAYAALRWLAGDAGAAEGVDPARLAVLGESAGGGLAAALAMLARDRGGPALAAQILDAPTVDDRLATPSMRDLPDTPTWKASNSRLSWRYYLAGTAAPGDPDVPLYAAPARAGADDLAGLPPAWVTAYQIDPTRDEVLDHALALIRAGVPTEVHHYSGAFHLAHAVPGTAIGERIVTDRLDAVRRLLGGPPRRPATAARGRGVTGP
ncbi:alpha/beta hydrolase [Streptomyces avicenniae]|uniref:alpha/beta hydrolase n=1 Tax=Streptomyces avicenniae TaxID=500153 RepID=UPI00069C51B4|nr:alpha/beta hydrolase [Streptomyces avicenniae]